MKKFKTIIAIILAVVMCFSSAPLTAFANAVNATTIEVGTATAVIENPGDEALFSFTPTESSKYSLTSYSVMDTCAFLYDSNMEYITEDDDSGDANNFCLSYVLEAGTTYYFGVKFYDTSTNGRIPIELIKSKAIKSIAVETMPDKTEYVEGYVDGNIDVTGLELKFTWIDDTTDIWQYSNENPCFEGVELQKSYMFDDEISQAKILLSYENVSTSFNITLIDNPVESIEIIDEGFPTLIENTYGDWDFYHNEETDQDEEFFCYSYGDYYDNLFVKITYNDGRPDDLVSLNEWQHNGYQITQWDSQYQKPWTKGATDNTIYVEYLGAEASYNVAIGDSPVESIEIIDNGFPDLMENTNGVWQYYWNEETEQDEDFYFYNYYDFLENLSVKINYNDGRDSATYPLKNSENFEIAGQHFDASTAQYTMPWTKGAEDNTITFEYAGKTATYNVNIVANPVKSIEIIDNGFPNLIENMNGDWEERYNDATGQYEDHFWYDYFSYLDKISLKITYNDGREPVIHAVNGGELDGYSITYSDNQYSSPWVKGGDNTITFNYLGAEVTYNVNIVENPVKEIEIVAEGNPTLIEGGDGYYTDGWDEETDSWVPFFCYELTSDFISKLKVKITYTDNSHKFVPFEYALYGEAVDGHYFSAEVYQSLHNQWEVGGDNIIEVSYLGKTATYNVQIEESPIASIEVIDTNVTPLEEDSNGWQAGEWVDEEYKHYFYYSVDYSKFGLKINYKDPEKDPKIVTDITKKVDGYWVEINTEQSYNNQWTIGGENNTITFSYIGATTTYNMPIVSNPVASIEITSAPTKQYIYGDISNGYLDDYDGTYSIYLNNFDFTGLAFTVHFKDNTTKNYTYNDMKYERGEYSVDGFDCYFEFTEGYEVAIGDNEVVITYRGVSDTYNIKVLESPVQSIEILEAPTRTEYTKGGFVEYYQGMKIKITYKDIGEKIITLSDDNILYFALDSYDTGGIYFIDNGYYYSIHTYIDATDFENQITKTIVKGMGIIEVGEELIIKGENFVRSYEVNSYDLSGNVNITITYEDNSTETLDLTPIAYKDWEGAEDWYDRYFIAKTPHGTVCYNIYQPDKGESYYFNAFYDEVDLPDPEYTPGDIDDSGEVTLDDVVALAQVVAGWQNVSHNPSALDANGDGEVTLDDVVLLAQYVAGWSGITLN